MIMLFDFIEMCGIKMLKCMLYGLNLCCLKLSFSPANELGSSNKNETVAHRTCIIKTDN